MAVTAYAKGAVVYIALLQELFFLGAPEAKETVISQFAGRAASWLQDRVSFLTNINTTLLTVMDASSIDGINGNPLIIRWGPVLLSVSFLVYLAMLHLPRHINDHPFVIPS